MSLLETYQTHFSKEELLKAEIKEIVRSYRHSWDIFSELIQNSIDAINRKFLVLNDPAYDLYTDYRSTYGPIEPNMNFRGKITIVWDADKHELAMSDNGIGIEADKVGKFILPKGTGKRVGYDYGFKGYGLTFATFISCSFDLRTKFLFETNTTQIALDECFGWLCDVRDFPTGPVAVPTPTTDGIEGESGTVVKVTLSPEDYATLFPAVASLDSTKRYIKTDRDIKRLLYILRTRTAIGNTRSLYNKAPRVPIDIELKIIIDGNVSIYPVPYKYYHPLEHDEVGTLAYNFDQYVESLNKAGFKRDFRALYHTVENVEVGINRKLKFDVALCAVAQKRLTKIEGMLELDKIESSDVGVTYGIHLSINGMPTGIRIDNWDHKGGYLKRYYVVVDAELGISEQLDPGRKGISEYYANLISKRVIDLLGETSIGGGSPFGHFATTNLDSGRIDDDDIEDDDFYTIVERVENETSDYSEEEKELLEKIKRYSSFNKIPSTEQEVIGIFYQLLSKGVIKGYTTDYLSGVATYDAAFK